MSQPEITFEYTIRRNGSILILFFTGILQENNCARLEQVWSEVRDLKEVRHVLIELSQLKNLTLGAIPAFVKLQKSLRENKIEFKICATPEDLKSKLSRMGVIRNIEIASNLKAAVEVISQMTRSRAA